jgi:hypothetical protein
VSKGDIIVISTGRDENSVITARQNGRKVVLESEKDLGLGWVVAKEVTRGGTVIREARVVATEVVSITIERKDNDA